MVGVFGISVVFVVLISISFLIKLISSIFGRVRENEPTAPSEELSNGQAAAYQSRELELIDVDEKTAALIMAIVSSNTNIPLSKLQFKTIRPVKQKG
jgi:Na+-transporting methylmalonyl-CoA/oxaloacetate decarboxylase gamma subunit